MVRFQLMCAVVTLISVITQGASNAGNPMDGLETLKNYEARRESSSDPNWERGNHDFRSIAPGETLTIADIEGPGKIVHIWFTVNAEDQWYSRLLVLRMYWDGADQPCVEVPLGDFFAQGHGVDMDVNSMPVRVSSEGRARNCYWPMPFHKSARITVTNEGKGNVHSFYYYIDWQKHESLPEDTAYFHAQYRQEFPTRGNNENYVILEAEGRGHYVGTVQSVRLNDPGWYGEGDDFFFIDGEEVPSLKGTGTEDYFCDAWGFRKLDGLYYGLPIFEGYETGDLSVAYRWHIPDPIPFRESLRLEIEPWGILYGDGFAERRDDYATVAFWYQTEPHKPFPELPPANERLLYNPDEIILLVPFYDQVTASPEGRLQIQPGWGLGGSQIFFIPEEDGGSLSINIPVDEAGVYDVILFSTVSWDYGIYQVFVNGEAARTPIDFYVDGTTTREFRLGRLQFKEGENELSFEARGKNANSQGYYLGVHGLLLRPIE